MFHVSYNVCYHDKVNLILEIDNVKPQATDSLTVAKELVIKGGLSNFNAIIFFHKLLYIM